jgi:hypothetical protein
VRFGAEKGHGQFFIWLFAELSKVSAVAAETGNSHSQRTEQQKKAAAARAHTECGIIAALVGDRKIFATLLLLFVQVRWKKWEIVFQRGVCARARWELRGVQRQKPPSAPPLLNFNSKLQGEAINKFAPNFASRAQLLRGEFICTRLPKSNCVLRNNPIAKEDKLRRAQMESQKWLDNKNAAHTRHANVFVWEMYTRQFHYLLWAQQHTRTTDF